MFDQVHRNQVTGASTPTASSQPPSSAFGNSVTRPHRRFPNSSALEQLATVDSSLLSCLLVFFSMSLLVLGCCDYPFLVLVVRDHRRGAGRRSWMSCARSWESPMQQGKMMINQCFSKSILNYLNLIEFSWGCRKMWFGGCWRLDLHVCVCGGMCGSPRLVCGWCFAACTTQRWTWEIRTTTRQELHIGLRYDFTKSSAPAQDAFIPSWHILHGWMVAA